MRAFIVTLVSCALFSASVLFAGCKGNKNIAVGFYRTIVNTNTEQYAVVDSQKEVVTLYDKADHVIWATNVVAGLKKAEVGGERKISGMQADDVYLYAKIGVGYAVIVIKTGELKGLSRD